MRQEQEEEQKQEQDPDERIASGEEDEGGSRSGLSVFEFDWVIVIVIGDLLALFKGDFELLIEAMIVIGWDSLLWEEEEEEGGEDRWLRRE